MTATRALTSNINASPNIQPQAAGVNRTRVQRHSHLGCLRRASWAFSTRRVIQADWSTVPAGGTPTPGDLVLARVDTIGHHDGLQLTNGRRKTLFIGDEIVVAYGNRYACNQFEALVPDTMGPCHLVAGGGIAGRVVSSHDRIAKGPTHITPLALLANTDGQRVNLRDYALKPASHVSAPFPTIVTVVGTAMDSGKTQTSAYLTRGLIAAGLRVGYAKVTGTGAGGDTWLLKDAGAHPVLDFTDAGMASTYLVSPEEVESILVTLTAHIAQKGVDAIVVEIADGVFQRETAALLCSPVFNRLVGGTVLAARDAMGASAGVTWLRAQSRPVLALSGLLSASPLQSAEVKEVTGIPVYNRESLAEANIAMAVIGPAQAKPNRGQSNRATYSRPNALTWSLPTGRVLRRVLQSDPMQEYLLYVPDSGGTEAPILVAVHGLACNPEELARVFGPYCETAGVVMLAPIFSTEQHGDFQRLGRVGRGVRADIALDRCVAEVVTLTNADAGQLHLFGYSGGAQFVHRYLMAHPHRVAGAVAASAGWYTFPDMKERYPYGIRRQRRLPGVTFNPEEFLRVPVTVLVGLDDLNGEHLRSTDRVNRQQGRSRIERARNWVAAMRTAAIAYGYEPCVTCVEVPDVDHAFANFCERGALQERVFAALFGPGRCADLSLKIGA